MEPIITQEGFNVLRDEKKSRDLLRNYYTSLGFNVVQPTAPSPQSKTVAAKKAQTPKK